MIGRSRPTMTALALTATLAAAIASPTDSSLAQASGNPSPVRVTIPNGGFEQGTMHWAASGAARRRVVAGARSKLALRVTTRSSGRAQGRRVPTVVRGTRLITDAAPAGSTYSWSVQVNGNRTGLPARLVVREILHGRALQTRATTVRSVRNRWTRATVRLTRGHAGSAFEVRLGSPRLGVGEALRFDNVTGRRLTTPPTAPAAPVPPPGAAVLSNGCAVSERGIPACGAYLGSAYGSNTDPLTMERETGRRLGIHRVYYRGDQVAAAVAVASKDVAAGRLPWVSFKLPYSWEDMAAGRGDAWALDLATRMGALPGPVWLAFHHEPETDGDIQAWRRMQERLAPIVRGASDNLGFTVIMTGWHQFYGDAQYRLGAIWPQVKVDVAAFDIYEKYGVVKDGRTTTKWTNLRTAYFDRISVWARSVGVHWAIAETGFTDTASEVRPHWVRDTYADLQATGGIAFAYFNTTLNSIAPWHLGTQRKVDSYREAAVESPLLPLP